MKKVLTMVLAGAMACSVGIAAAGCGKSAKAFSDPQAILTAGELSAKTQISDELFGIFLEDINYTSQVMDANLIPNGSFEGITAYPYNKLWQGNASLSKGTDGFAESAPNYAKLDVEAGDYLSNAGYDYVQYAVEKGVKYTFSAFIRADNYQGPIEFKLVDKENTAVLEGKVDVKKSDKWVKYVSTVKAGTTATEGLSFELDFPSSGSLGVDGVKLVTSESTGGIKNYVYDALAALKPKFVRFPGGCIIEGIDDEIVYDWKNSIGALAKDGDDTVPALTYMQNVDGVESEVTTRGEPLTRKPNGDLWQGAPYYAMEYGVGFYEYFILCEELGASPIPILNCGALCMGRTGGVAKPLAGRHGNGVKDFIQDALDLVAFANGKTDSADENEAYWANVRKDMGHAEPFNVKYLGIGNEQWGGYYSYYEQFLAAFKEAAKTNPIYGAVQPIVGCGTQFHDTQFVNGDGLALAASKAYRRAGNIDKLSEYGIVDHHYYLNYYDFLHFAGANMTYNKYSREENDKYEVFVGEYSANEPNTRYVGANGTVNTAGTAALQMPAPMNSWITALSEAAYMTGLERNGDVVKLAAYAPVFGVCGKEEKDDIANQWDVDMMYFTNTELLLTPNYYVQQIFAPNTGTHVLTSSVEYRGIAATYGLPSLAAGVQDIERLFTVVSYDETTGDIIVKIVNAGAEEVKLNVDLGGTKVKSSASVTSIAAPMYAVNTLTQTNVQPKTSKLSGVRPVFGYAAEPFSVSIIRIPT